MLVLNPVHLNHENMQHIVPSRDGKWDDIRSMIKFDEALVETKLENYGLY